jgi:hypothetical protein
MSFFAVCTLRRALRSNLSHLISFYFNIIFIMPVITRSQSWKFISHNKIFSTIRVFDKVTSRVLGYFFSITFAFDVITRSQLPVITRSQSWKLSHTTQSSQQSEYSTRSQVQSFDISSLLPLHLTSSSIESLNVISSSIASTSLTDEHLDYIDSVSST